jgi:spore germination protein YaaH
MTRFEKYGPGGIKATFKKKILKPYAKEIAEGKKISSAYISSIEKKAKEAGEVTKEYWKRKAEKAQPIIERTMAPVISTAEMARMRAREKMEELRARAASNKKIQESIEKTKEFQNVMVNNFNRSSNVISSSVSSIANGMQNKMADFNIDPSVLDIIKGDLE